MEQTEVEHAAICCSDWLRRSLLRGSQIAQISVCLLFGFMNELNIERLHIAVGDQEIVRGLTLRVPRGEVHALMGPNGSGKSTLAKVLAGHPDYRVTAGKISMDG